MQTDCKQFLRIGKIRALNGCTRRLFRAATRHNHKTSGIKKAHVGNDQEKAQSERNSQPKTEVGKTKLTIRYFYLENIS